MKNIGIDYFGRHHPLAQLHNQSTLKMRYKMYQFLRSVVGDMQGKVFLDHGSTPDTRREASNCFLRWLIKDGAKVYAASPENITHLAQEIPGVTVIEWPLPPIQFIDRLDCTLSSAVIEHVGTKHDQIKYVESLLEFSPCLFITTPNRFHWLEFHTKLPLLHWLPKAFHRGILRLFGLKFWSNEKNLNLISKTEFENIIQLAANKLSVNIKITWYTPIFLGMVSNLCVLIEKN